MTQIDVRNKLRHLAICVEYDGSCFHGWQMQANAISVQQTLQDAWLKLTGERIAITGCSRTDAGVHANNHVSDFFTSVNIPVDKVPLAFNSMLPTAVSVKVCTEVSTDFNARFNCRGKLYTYDFTNNPIRPAKMRNFCTHVPGKLNLPAMQSATQLFVGRQDFSAVCDVGTPVKSKIRTITRCDLTSERDLLRISVAGDGFLYHMVRIIAGSIIYVGQGKFSVKELAELLKAGDRRQLGKTMPPQGLTLQKVYYEPQIFVENVY